MFMILSMTLGAGSSYDHGVLREAIESESFTIVVEVLLPNTDRMHPKAIHRVQVGAIVDWQMALSSQLSSNLSVVQLPDNILGIWLP
jgi:hypothetical protein